MKVGYGLCANLRGVALVVVVGGFTACAPHADAVYGEPGAPLPGLDGAELAEFLAGAVLFDKVFTPEEGLGPLFNENQCSACHTDPASGGTGGSGEEVVKATRYEGPGACDALSREGGENIRKQATPLMRAHGVERETIPPSATERGEFTAPPLFGLGLVEAIPDKAILAREDPDDSDADGISGRPGRTADGRLARFSRKAEVATLLEFIDSALRFEMGLTTPLKTEEETINGMPVPPETDPAPDPEVDERTVALLTAFVRFLTPPARAIPRSEAHRDSVATGQRLFDGLGCTACHTPSMRTAPSEIPALDRKTVNLYSDLLLHDMGPALADVCGFTATPAELRTEMLMGLRHRPFFLHDGRSFDLREAILEHGGEAQRARDAFSGSGWLAQEYVVMFLLSL
ncbi:MAG: hypothetical protein IH876_14600 [Gemmatimonadetes bacterium]|nr:hypothetical protein [Gemmatimonadota bacterium]